MKTYKPSSSEPAIEGKPAARVGDLHKCPIHGGGPVVPPGKPTVWIGGKPAATMGTLCTCAGPPDVIIEGSRSVFICGMPAARQGDHTLHSGVIVGGEPTVLIGDEGPAVADAGFLETGDSDEVISKVTGYKAKPAGSGSSDTGPTRISDVPHLPQPEPEVGVNLPPECRYLAKRSNVAPPKFAFGDRPPNDVQTPSQPRRFKYQFFNGSAPEDALEYTVLVNGQAIKVIVPVGTSWYGYMPTIQQIVLALLLVPPEALSGMPSITINPHPYIAPKFLEFIWQYIPGFSPPPTVLGIWTPTGIILFPIVVAPPQGLIDYLILHESGHALSIPRWRRSPLLRRRWEAAVKADRPNSASTYADTNYEEDFAESMVMYFASRGTACEAYARRMFPHRYHELDLLFGKKPMAG